MRVRSGRHLFHYALALAACPIIACADVESPAPAPVGESQEAIKQCPDPAPPPLACWDVVCVGPLSDPYWDYLQRPYGTSCQGDGHCDNGGSCIHPPAAPGNVRLGAPVTTRVITLQWDAALFAAHYNVDNVTNNSGYNGLSGTTFAWEGLSSGRRYCFTVTGSNEFGAGPPSPQLCATTLSTTPIWVSAGTSSCADQCGTNNCNCIPDRCIGDPQGQACSPVGDSCNVVSGPSFKQLDCRF